MATYKGIGYDAVAIRNRTGTSSDTISFNTNMIVAGNLDVTGNIISRDEERVLVQDNFLDINFGYTTVAGLEGGVAVNYLPVAGGRDINSTSANITFAAASGGTRPTLSVAQAQLPNGTFAINDIIQIAGTTNAENDGFYVVQALTNADPAVLSVKSTAITSPDTINAKFAQVNFTAEVESASTSVTLTKVNVNVLQTSTAGAWQVQNGSVDGTFATFTPLGTSTLQQAYDAGSSITTDASGDILFTLSADAQGFSVEGSSGGNGDVSIGGATAVSSYTINATGGASAITSTGQNLTVSTATSGTLALTSAATLDLNAVACTLDATGGFTGAFQGAASSITSTGQNLSIATATSGELDLTSAGALDLNGVAVTIDGTAGITMAGSGGASGWQSTSQNLSFATVTSGELDITSAAALDLNGVAVTIDGSAGLSLDGTGAASNLSSTGQALSIETLTSGALDVTSAGTLACTGASTSTFGDDTAVWSFDGSGAVTETGMTSIAVTPSAAITLTGGAASSYTTSAGALTLTSAAAATWSTGAGLLGITGAAGVTVTSTGGTLTLEGTGQTVDINSNALDIDAAGAVTVDAAGNSSISVTTGTTAAASGLLRLESSYPMLVKKVIAQANLAVGEVVQWTNNSGALNANKTDADAASTSTFAGIVVTAANATDTASVAISGVIDEVTSDTAYNAGNHLGKAVYISLSAGKITPTAPSAAGDTVFQVGLCVGGSGTAWEVSLQPQFIMEIG